MSDTPDVPPTLSDAVDAAIDRGETAAIATIDELLKRPGTEAGLEILRTVRIDAKLVRSVRDESDHALARRLLVDDAVSRRSPSKARRTGRQRLTAAALTASAAVALLISVASLLPRPAAASVGRVVAVAEGTVWADGAGPLGVDDAIDADRVIELTEGFVTVEVGRDVSIDLVGPVRARIDAERIVRLDEGLLAGVVGPAGRGFTVTTEDATVVDLGTRFQVHKDRASGTQVRVTSGRVEATLRRDDGGDAKVLDLVAGESARFDATTGLVDGLEALFDFETAYAPVEGAKGDVRRFAGAAKPLSGPVVGLDFRSRAFLTRGKVFVIPERRGVKPDGPVALSDGTTLPADAAYDSYLLHCDLGDGFDVEAIGEGSVTFGGPIAALIVTADDLVATDAAFATAGSRFEPGAFRGLEPDADVVEVSGSGEVVTFDLSVQAGRSLDQVRVLVPAETVPF